MTITIIASLAVLIMASIQDLKEKQIYIIFPMLIMIVGLTVRFYEGELISPAEIIAAVGILIVTIASRQKLGMGDSLLIIALTFAFGIKLSIRVFFEAVFLMYIFLLIFNKKDRKIIEMPFVPFMCSSFILCLLI